MSTKTLNKAKIIDYIANQAKMRNAIDDLIFEAINQDEGINYIRLIKPIVTRFYKMLEDCITTSLSNIREGEELNITLLNGLHIRASMLPPEEQHNNLTGETITTKRKIKAKAHFSRYFVESLIEGNDN